MPWSKDQRIAELRGMTREQVEARARQLGVKPHRNLLVTIRRIEEREFKDVQRANKLPHIKDIF